MATGIANTPLINYFRYKQSTNIATTIGPCCNPFTAVADGGNGQLVITTADTSFLSVGQAIILSASTIPQYDGNYSVISLTSTTINISGDFLGTATGAWEQASNLIGSTAGKPLDFGVITFYDNDNQITLQDTYSDRVLTVLNPNPIILDAVGSYPPIYLIDKPYYIVIKDKFNNLVATLENYLPDNSINPTSGSEIANLFPNYGFDTQVNDNIYDEVTVDLNGSTQPSAGWNWGIATTQNDAVNTFRFEIVSDSGLLANPKNELVIRSANKTSGETINRLSSILGDYNVFQGLQLGFSIYGRVVSGSNQNLVCELIRTRNGVDQTPINVGIFSITGARTQETFLFTVPILTDANYSNNDAIRFVINFPLNTDFEYGLTGTWLQISDDGTISPTEESGHITASKEFFGGAFRKLQSPSQYEYRGLPLVVNTGFADILNETGSIFQSGSPSDDLNYAVSMIAQDDIDPGVELLRDNVIKMTQTNRLIDFLRSNDITQSRHTFTVDLPDLMNILDIGLGIGAAPNSAWTSLAAPRITVADAVDEFTVRLNVTTLGNGKTKFLFVDQFDAFVNPHEPIYSGTPDGLFLGSPPSVIPDWFISVDYVIGQTNGVSSRHYYFNSTVINNGSVSDNAEIDFELKDANNITYAVRAEVESNANNNLGARYIFLTNNIYHNQPFERLQAGGANVVNYFTGFWAYNDVALNISPQPAIPPRVIHFDVDGNGTSGPLGTLSTVTVPITSNMSRQQISVQLSKAINNSFTKTITIVSLPNNGDIVQMSNDQTDFNLIFYDTDQTQPLNPDSRVPIYVQYTTAQTTIVIAATAKSAIESAVMGVPRAADLGLEFSDDLEYFMVL